MTSFVDLKKCANKKNQSLGLILIYKAIFLIKEKLSCKSHHYSAETCNAKVTLRTDKRDRQDRLK